MLDYAHTNEMYLENSSCADYELLNGLISWLTKVKERLSGASTIEKQCCFLLSCASKQINDHSRLCSVSGHKAKGSQAPLLLM